MTISVKRRAMDGEPHQATENLLDFPVNLLAKIVFYSGQSCASISSKFRDAQTQCYTDLIRGYLSTPPLKPLAEYAQTVSKRNPAIAVKIVYETIIPPQPDKFDGISLLKEKTRMQYVHVLCAQRLAEIDHWIMEKEDSLAQVVFFDIIRSQLKLRNKTYNLYHSTSMQGERVKEWLSEPKNLQLVITRITAIHQRELRIERLPAWITILSNLKRLSLPDSCIRELPVEFGTLTRLEILELKGNRLLHLPTSFSNLQHLRILNLANNCLPAFPPPVLKLADLETLDLSHNAISTLPEGDPPPAALRKLFLACNPIAKVPDLWKRVTSFHYTAAGLKV